MGHDAVHIHWGAMATHLMWLQHMCPHVLDIYCPVCVVHEAFVSFDTLLMMVTNVFTHVHTLSFSHTHTLA